MVDQNLGSQLPSESERRPRAGFVVREMQINKDFVQYKTSLNSTSSL